MALPHGRSTGREGFSPRDYVRALGTTFAYTPRVMAMVWRTSPGLTAGVAGVTVVRALIPAATIWLTKLVIDAVVDAIAVGGTDGSINRVVTLVVLQLALALAATALDHSGNALRALLGDRFSNRINIMILEKAETLDLAYFEDSTFYDMLERARREANMRPARSGDQHVLAGRQLHSACVGCGAAGVAGVVDSAGGGRHVHSLPGRGHVVRAGALSNELAARPRSPRLWYLGYVMTSDETVRRSGSSTWAATCWHQYRRTFARFYRENRKLTLSRESVTFALGLVSAGTASGLYIVVALATSCRSADAGAI